jgi:hypothetical protein
MCGWSSLWWMWKKNSSALHGLLENEFVDEREETFKEWCDYITEIETDNTIPSTTSFEIYSKCFNLLSNLSEEGREFFLHTPGVNIEVPGDASQLAERYTTTLGDYQFTLLDLSLQLFKSRNFNHQISSLFFMTSVVGHSLSDEIREDLDAFFALIKSDNLLLSSLGARLATLIASQDKSFVDSLATDSDLIHLLINRLVLSHQHMTELLKTSSASTSVSSASSSSGSSEELADEILPMNLEELSMRMIHHSLPHPPLTEENQDDPLFKFYSFPESLSSSTGWSLPQLEWIACSSLALLSCVADVLDLLGSLLAQNIVQVTIDLMKLSSLRRRRGRTSGAPTPGGGGGEGGAEGMTTCLFPALLISSGHFFEKAFAHRKLSLEFIERSGIELLSQLYSIPCASHLESVLTSSLYTLVSHSQVMEKIIRRKKDELSLVYQLIISYLLNCLTFSTRENVVAVISMVLPYRPSYTYFSSTGIMTILFQLLRVCLFTRPSNDQLSEGEPSDQEEEESKEGEIDETPPSLPSLRNTSERNLPTFAHPKPEQQSVELMYQCAKEIGSDRLNELRDDILRVLLIYLRIGALLDLELSSPESLSPMCGGTGNQWASSIQSKLLGGFSVSESLSNPVSLLSRSLSTTSQHDNPSASLDNTLNSSMHASQYTVITFDGEDTCSGSAEALLHAMREYVSNYNDLIKHPNQIRSPLVSNFRSRRDLVWCTPVKLPSTTATTTSTPSFTTNPFTNFFGSDPRRESLNASLGSFSSSSYISPVKEILKHGYLSLLLYILQTESMILHGNTSTIICLLQLLELLCLNPTVIEQMCNTLILFTTISGQREIELPDNRNGLLDEEELSDEMESLNGLSLVLDIACRGPKRFVFLLSFTSSSCRDSLVKAHALHVLRSLVTPPEYTLLPTYISQEDVEKYTSETRSSRHSVGVGTPTASLSKYDRGVPIGRVISVATPATFECDIQRLVAPEKMTANDANQFDERPVSPTSSSISSIRYIPISTIIERAQKIARGVIRKCNGIHIIAACLETPITHYIYNIRLAVIQVPSSLHSLPTFHSSFPLSTGALGVSL